MHQNVNQSSSMWCKNSQNISIYNSPLKIFFFDIFYCFCRLKIKAKIFFYSILYKKHTRLNSPKVLRILSWRKCFLPPRHCDFLLILNEKNIEFFSRVSQKIFSFISFIFLWVYSFFFERNNEILWLFLSPWPCDTKSQCKRQ